MPKPIGHGHGHATGATFSCSFAQELSMTNRRSECAFSGFPGLRVSGLAPTRRHPRLFQSLKPRPLVWSARRLLGILPRQRIASGRSLDELVSDARGQRRHFQSDERMQQLHAPAPGAKPGFSGSQPFRIVRLAAAPPSALPMRQRPASHRASAAS
jgi:hypothetical protein